MSLDPKGESTIDRLLANASIAEVDFLSIDIDGDDYHIFKHMKLRPTVICIEFNPSIPPPIIFAGDLGAAQGSSLAAFEALARTKGYALVYATGLNAFFVRSDAAHHFVELAAGECYPPENASSHLRVQWSQPARRFDRERTLPLESMVAGAVCDHPKPQDQAPVAATAGRPDSPPDHSQPPHTECRDRNQPVTAKQAAGRAGRPIPVAHRRQGTRWISAPSTSV
jgi:hypothetical protein